MSAKITDVMIAKAMARYGGSFVRHLGAAALCADPENLARLKAAWPEYWAEYAEFAKRDDDRGGA